MSFGEAVLKFLQSILESPDFRAFVITLITLGVAWATTQRARIKNRAEAEQRAESRRVELETQYQSQVKAIEVKRDELVTQMASLYQSKVQEVDGLRQTTERQAGELKTLTEQVDSLTKMVANYEKEAEDLNEKLRVNTESLALKNKTIGDLEIKQGAADKRIKALEREREGWQEILSKREKEIADLKIQVKERDATIEKMAGDLKRMQKRLDDLEARADVVSVSIDSDKTAGNVERE